MSGYRLHDTVALLAALVAPFLVALVPVPFRTDLSATNAALILVVSVVAVAAHLARLEGTARPAEDGRSPQLRVVDGGHHYGRFLLDPLPGPLASEQDLLVAVAPAAQAGSALDTAGLSHQA
ncbi:hypothetical protein Snoj_40320 [Streptomyces nojiriensis]|uniref:Uncharacterized protein n=1 Tax=Streptomyces nojiriensis TaxID=66374 RepID=A0ABQ3SPR0_9ACTN|nr:hypothetical protein [Streptomyces nojiriensis]QTI43651.1 hypothetical protein JYK04_01413 [Streptomyces nojiriensis]GGR82568.1 hypothetical protein GCM10010205_08970 [Streptomyces nojiriensis]GHI70114.1 hypothetical protein Snoj_40320 [Streptomyces nojiriensis]